ncbi:EamA family transporter [Clostridiales bacterium]|nr:EamA family transporter [Clostridiales bacterium]
MRSMGISRPGCWSRTWLWNCLSRKYRGIYQTGERTMRKQVKADLMLVLVTLCWGVSYYLMDLSLADLGPFTLNAFRFLGAFFIALVIAFPKLKTINKITLKYSVILGGALTLVYIGCTFGVMYTSLSNSGFLCALTVIFTPIFAFVFKKQVPNKKLSIVVIMCLVGIALLTLNE